MDDNDALPDHVAKIWLALRAATARGAIGEVAWLRTCPFVLEPDYHQSHQQPQQHESDQQDQDESQKGHRNPKNQHLVAMFPSADLLESEELVKSLMLSHGLGSEFGSINVLPVESQQPRLKAPMDETESSFMQSIKSRILVESVVQQTREQAAFSFDFLMLLIVASLLAGIGLATNNPVVVVASMLVSPIMGPILAVTFGLVVRDFSLVRTGAISESSALGLCVVCGLVVGLCMGSFAGEWGGWPTNEMASRGQYTGLAVGIAIALPSGIGVALSVLGNNTSSLVGVAISASLLPPAVNTGLCLAYALIWPVSQRRKEFCSLVQQAVEVITDTTSAPTMIPPAPTSVFLGNNVPGPTSPAGTMYTTTTTIAAAAAEPPVFDYVCAGGQQYWRGDFALLGFVSFLLTLVNIVCVLLAAYLMYKVKEVAPLPGKTDFWAKDVPAARNYTKAIKPDDVRTKKLARRLQAALAHHENFGAGGGGALTYDLRNELTHAAGSNGSTIGPGLGLTASEMTLNEISNALSLGGRAVPPPRSVSDMMTGQTVGRSNAVDISDLLLASAGGPVAAAAAPVESAPAAGNGTGAEAGQARVVPASLAALFTAPSAETTPIKSSGKRRKSSNK